MGKLPWHLGFLERYVAFLLRHPSVFVGATLGLVVGVLLQGFAPWLTTMLVVVAIASTASAVAVLYLGRRGSSGTASGRGVLVASARRSARQRRQYHQPLTRCAAGRTQPTQRGHILARQEDFIVEGNNGWIRLKSVFKS